MNIPTTSIMRALLALALWLCASTSQAQEKWSSCRPVETMSFSTRVHVKCAVPVDGTFWYFAASAQDARFATRMLNLSMVGQVAEKTLAISFDPNDQSGVTFGCLAHDCRTARAIGLTEAAPPIAPGPIPSTPVVPTPARAACTFACNVVAGDCMDEASSVADRQQCIREKAQCVRDCP